MDEGLGYEVREDLVAPLARERETVAHADRSGSMRCSDQNEFAGR
jgi:hypothetical protein